MASVAEQQQLKKEQLLASLGQLLAGQSPDIQAAAILAVGNLNVLTCATLMEREEDVRRAAVMQLVQHATAAAAATASIKPSSPPPEKKSLTIQIPPILHGDEVKTFLMTVEDEDELKEYLRCAQVVGLQKVADGGSNRLVRKFAELVDGGVYTHAPCSEKAFARLLGEVRHLQQAREDEFGRAMLQHLQEAEPEEEYELREDLRNLYNATNQILEDDVVIVGNTAAWVGSHKTHVKGAKPVKQIAERARELGKLPNQLPAGVKPAFMVERADAHVERKVDRACRDMQVMRFKRSGQVIKPVNSMVAAGMQQLLRF